MGRPSLAPKLRRSRVLRIRLNAEEDAAVRRAGAGQLTQWARQAILDAAAARPAKRVSRGR
jgi:hypothetical protein